MKPSRFCTTIHYSCLTYVIRHSEHSNPSSWNTTKINNNRDSERQTILIFKQTRCSGIKSVELTYASLFKACASLLALEEGRQIHVDCFKHGLDPDVYVRNTMIHFYGSCKKIIDARKVFDEMPHTNVVSWNTIISTFFRVSWFYESVEYFMKMRDVNIEPNGTTLVVMLSVCAELGNLTFGKCVHSRIILKRLELDCRLGTALVNMYAKCGALNYARLVFDKMPERNVWTWSAMIQGLAQHGVAKHAIALFNEMKNTSIQPNHVTFLGVICACSHAGYVEDGYRFFKEMKHVYGIKPRLTHYGAMVDVLGRTGHLIEAHNFILKMPIEPDPTVWRALLSACSVHSASDFDGIGEKVQKKLLELEPRWSPNLVMVANKYAEVCKWEDAARLRKSMRFKRLKKIAGESCIEVNGSTFRLLSGHDSHATCVDIYSLLDGLSLNMKINNL
ncbi:pentatricopeptide repeat-containing protein At2g36730-like [Bidens hawaiensis]|uniref:pentatricopeptide repeat-containing protein At2g36730-like n=1 Tax=Bidens hawaiensis TaxID=980011 RepID=UPI004049E16A